MTAFLFLFLLHANERPESHALPLPPALRRLVNPAVGDPWKGDSTPKGFRIIALSTLADGCAFAGRDPTYRDAAKQCVEQTYRRALALDSRATIDKAQGVYQAHLNLILGAADQLGDCLDPQRHAALSQGLALGTLTDPLGIHPSFPKNSHRWPADQQVVLASLHRHDQAHKTHLLAEPLRRWHAIEERYATPSGLLWSDISETDEKSKLPRGCALSWGTRYQSEFDPKGAARTWKAYVDEFYVEVTGLSGFREWPAGVNGAADVDSGPIVLGVGAAATAFGIAAAHAVGDAERAAALEKTATFFETSALIDRELAASANTILARAIRFEGQHQATFANQEASGTTWSAGEVK